MVATPPASRKAKGRRFQQAVRQDLIERLGVPEGDVLSTAMGQSGCDLDLSPAARDIGMPIYRYVAEEIRPMPAPMLQSYDALAEEAVP